MRSCHGFMGNCVLVAVITSPELEVRGIFCEKVEIFAKVSLWEKTPHIKSVIDFPPRCWTDCNIKYDLLYNWQATSHFTSWTRQKISLFMFSNITAFYFCNNLAGPSLFTASLNLNAQNVYGEVISYWSGIQVKVHWEYTVDIDVR